MNNVLISCCLGVHMMCTMRAPCVHLACTSHAPGVHLACTWCAPLACTMRAHDVHLLCAVRAPGMHHVCTWCELGRAPSVHMVCTVRARGMHLACASCAPRVHPACTCAGFLAEACHGARRNTRGSELHWLPGWSHHGARRRGRRARVALATWLVRATEHVALLELSTLLANPVCLR